MSMDEFNPYAPPKASIGTPSKLKPLGAVGEMWWDGDALVVPKGAILPDACVKCGDVAAKRLRRNLSWHPAGYYLIILLNLLLYVIVALIVRKTAKVDVGLCERHARRRLTAILVGWTLALGGIAAIVVGVANEIGAPCVVGGFLIFAGLLTGAFGARVVYPKKIDDRYAWLKGVDSSFPVVSRDPYAWPAEPEF